MKNNKLVFLTLILIVFGCSKDDESSTLIIEDQTFTISENAAANEMVGTINVEVDESSEVTFSILSGNESNVFMLSADGQLSVQNNLLLDFETTSSYELLVEIQDNELSDQAFITINILDGPENVSTMDGFIRFENTLFEISEGIYFEEIEIQDSGTSGATVEVTNNYRLISGNVAFNSDDELVITNSSAQFILSTTQINPESRALGTFSLVSESEIEIVAALVLDGNGNGTLIETVDDLENDKVFFATNGTIKIEDLDEDLEILDFAIEVDLVISQINFSDEFNEENFQDFVIEGTETTLKFSFTKIFLLEEDDDSEPVDG